MAPASGCLTEKETATRAGLAGWPVLAAVSAGARYREALHGFEPVRVFLCSLSDFRPACIYRVVQMPCLPFEQEKLT
ncbi:MAG: hypothetical protein JWQ21_1909 [Herminiimonas sp.]|nr:hypothetical protein [Herminiimonas sp.]